MACPICKKKDKGFLLKVKDYEYDIKTQALYVQCKSCESIYRDYPKKIKKEIYIKKKYLPLKGNTIYNFFKHIYAKHEKNKIFESIGKVFFAKPKIILDIACGKGFLIEKFSKDKNLECYGTDINIRTMNKNNVRFVQSSFNNIKILKKLKPDLIIINNLDFT